MEMPKNDSSVRKMNTQKISLNINNIIVYSPSLCHHGYSRFLEIRKRVEVGGEGCHRHGGIGASGLHPVTEISQPHNLRALRRVDAEMQMGSGRVAGHTREPNHLAGRNVLTLCHIDTREARIQCTQAVTVRNHDPF